MLTVSSVVDRYIKAYGFQRSTEDDKDVYTSLDKDTGAWVVLSNAGTSEDILLSGTDTEKIDKFKDMVQKDYGEAYLWSTEEDFCFFTGKWQRTTVARVRLGTQANSFELLLS